MNLSGSPNCLSATGVATEGSTSDQSTSSQELDTIGLLLKLLLNYFMQDNESIYISYQNSLEVRILPW